MNKNTKRNKSFAAFNFRKGKDTTEFVIGRTQGGQSGYTLSKYPYTIARPNDNGVVSRNERRNMQMRVLHNKGENGTHSLTVHEPIDKNKPFYAYKNKNYKYD